MKANELRIGDLLMVKGEIVEVKSIDYSGGIEYERPFDKSQLFIRNLIDPNVIAIPLTPEILESSGFKWETTEKKHLQLSLPEQEINPRNISFLYLNGECKMLQYYMSDYFFSYFETKPPKYVHQLQNLYFALTGEELEITL